MLRKLAAVGVFAGTSLVTSVSSAVGLGEIKLYSALNQPLNAEIKLYQVSKADLASLQVGIASMRDFQRADIDRPFFLTDLNFEVIDSTGDSAVVRVTSSKAVAEPFLNFLVELEWQNGRVLKEYTLLMDLPSYTPPAATTVERQPTAQQQTQQPVQRQARPSASQVRESQWQNSDTEYRVRANDTLWEIALNVRPDRSYSPHQVMKALYDMNPDAFINNNMNRVKQGAVLRLPSAGDLDQIASGVAVAQLRQHNQAVDDGTTIIDATSNTSDYGQVVEQDRLVLDAAQTNGSASGQGESNTGSGVNTADLDAARDEVARQQRENEELRSRIEALEAQLSTASQLLELRNDELAAAQAVASSSNEVVTDENQVLEAVSDSEPEQAETDNQGEQQNTVEETASTAKQVNTVTIPEKKGVVESITDWVMSNLAIVGGAILALLLAVFAIRRRGQDEEETVSIVTPSVVELEPTEADDEADEGDVTEALADVDLKLAYGEFDQAEQALQGLADANPGNTAIALKLCELYADVGNRQRFDEQVTLIRSTGDDQAIESATALISRFDEEDGMPDLDALGLGDDFDEPEASEQADEVLDLDTELDFDLGTESDDQLDSEDVGETEAELDLTKESEEDFSIDTLDLDGLTFVSRDEEETSDEESAVVDSESVEQGVDSEADSEAVELEALSDTANEIELTDSLEDEIDLDLGGSLDELAGEVEVSAEDDTEELDVLEDVSLDLDDLDAELSEMAEDSDDLGEIELPQDDSLDIDAIELDDVELDAEFDESPVAVDVADDELETAGGELAGVDENDPLAALDDIADLDIDVDNIELDADSSDDLELDGLDLDSVELEQGDDFSEPLDGLDDIDLDYDLDDLAEADEQVEAEAEAVTPAVEEEPVDGSSELHGEEAISLDGIEMTADDVAADLTGAEDLEDFDFLADSDEIATKLDLARAYIDMGDKDGAREILDEVIAEGNDEQQAEAKQLSEKL